MPKYWIAGVVALTLIAESAITFAQVDPEVARQHIEARDNIKKTCDGRTTSQQKAAAQKLIRLNGYDCAELVTMCPFMFSEGYTVFCNDLRYKFELANHGGRWSVTPP